MAQSVKHLTLDFGSDHDLEVRFVRLSPEAGFVLTAQSLLGIVSLSLSLSLYPSLALSLSKINRSAWVAQLVKHWTSAQVMISRFVGSSPTWGSVLTAWRLEPALDFVSLSLYPSPTRDWSLSLSLSLSQK